MEVMKDSIPVKVLVLILYLYLKESITIIQYHTSADNLKYVNASNILKTYLVYKI